MKLDYIMTVQLMNSMAQAKFPPEIIAVAINRIELCDDEIGAALVYALSLKVENKEQTE